MTIDEHLQFSVLSAPIAGADRRALSQAWYSALYGASKPKDASARQTSPASALAQRTDKVNACAEETRRTAPTRKRPVMQDARESVRAGSSAGERRAARLPLARKIERRLLRPGGAARATFTLEGMRGRVQVLLQPRGSGFDLVAICSRTSRPQVLAALEQARYVLAKRGIELSARTLERASC